MEFMKIPIRNEIPTGYHLATCKEAEDNHSKIDSLVKEDNARLKDGYVTAGGEVIRSYLWGLDWKLVRISSDQEEKIPTAESQVVDDTTTMGPDNPLFLSLMYACELDDSAEAEELVKQCKLIAGLQIFKERLHDYHAVSTVLHNCAYHGSVKTLAVLLKSLMEDTQFQTSQRKYDDGDTPLTGRPKKKSPFAMDILNARNSWGDTPLIVGAYREHKEICSTLLENGASMELKDDEGNTVLHYAAWNDDVLKTILDHPGVENLQNLINQRNYGDATPLHRAAFWGSKGCCSALLKKGASMKLKDEYGNTALHVAVRCGNADAVEEILSFDKAEVLHLINQRNNGDATPLHLAAYEGNAEIYSTLLEKGASMELKDDSGDTALHITARKGIAKVVRESLTYSLKKGLHLINKTNNEDATPLHLAAYEGHVEICSALLENGAAMELKDKSGDTALHIAAEKEKANVVEAILTCPGAKKLHLINLTNKEDATPLHLAAYNGRVDICSTLLENGASIELKDESGDTALHVAAGRGFAKVVEAILAYPQAKDLNLINQRNKKDETPFHVATYKERKDIYSSLLQNGASMESKDNFGNTPLHVVAKYDQKDTVDFLIQKGAFVDTINDNEETPLHIATISCQYEVVRSLLSMNPQFEHVNDYKEWVNMRNSSGDTALHIAARGGNNNIVEDLIKNNARVDSRNSAGETPLHLAVKKSNLQVVVYLLRKENVNINLKFSRIPWSMYVRMCSFCGETPLHVAVREGHEDVMMKLLTEMQPDDLVIRDIENRTALFWAVQKPTSSQMMDELLKHAGDKNKAFLLWNLVTFHGDHKDNWSLKDKVLQEWGKVNRGNLLNMAAEEKDLDMAMELINKGGFEVTSLKNVEWRRWISENLRRKPSDQPALEDNLARTSFANGIAALLLNPFTGSPITIGIFGPWGMGKSSTMLQVEETLLRMVVSQTFKDPRSNQKQGSNEAMDSIQGFSPEGEKFREQVIAELKKSLKTDEEKVKTKKHTGCETLAACFQVGFRKDKTNEENMKANKGNHNGVTGDDIFPLKYQSSNPELIKHLALTNRSKLFAPSKRRRMPNLKTITRCLKKEQATKEEQEQEQEQANKEEQAIGEIPAILTVRYNAWHYKNKTEASAGLALGIIQELENSMTPPQQTRMCWRYSWNCQRKEIFLKIILPLFLAIAAVCIMAIPWMAIPIKTSYKALALPLSFAAVCWVFFRNILNIAKPIAQTIMDNVRSPDHKAKLGYEKQVIDDIIFVRDEFCEEADGYWWIILGFLVSFFISTGYNIKGTRLRKQVPVKENFRIVVFIDDLDRCQEDTILELMSTINLILGACRINVVVGIDKGMVQNAITKFYLKDSANPSESKCRDLAERYIRKIIQLPIPLPEPSRNSLKFFIRNQIGKSCTLNDEHANAIKEDDKKIKGGSNLDSHKQQENASNNADQQTITKESDPDSTTTSSSKGIHKTSTQNDGKQDHEQAVTPGGEVSILISQREIVPDPSATDDTANRNAISNNAANKPDPNTTSSSRDETFDLVLANYSPLEVDMLENLSEKATPGDNKSPREWKRFLNYHRLAWNILSQDHKMKEDKLKGWQRKLILWIFLCWNWSEQMDEIIKNWNQLLFEKPRQEKVTAKLVEENEDMPSLGDVIAMYLKEENEGMMQNVTNKDDKVDTENNSRENEDIQRKRKVMERKMNDMLKTLKEEYDLGMEFIQVFQQFRFYSILDNLEINDNMKKLEKKKATMSKN